MSPQIKGGGARPCTCGFYIALMTSVRLTRAYAARRDEAAIQALLTAEDWQQVREDAERGTLARLLRYRSSGRMRAFRVGLR